MAKETQSEMIILDLLEGRKLTPLDSYIFHGCSKLSSRVSELIRKKKWPIQKEMVEVKSRFGIKRVMQYSLILIMICLGECYAQSSSMVVFAKREDGIRIWYEKDEYDSLLMGFSPVPHFDIQGDTIKSILQLLRDYGDILKSERAASEALYEAENILQWIRTDGYVTNWKEWRKAVKRYQAIQNYKSVMQEP